MKVTSAHHSTFHFQLFCQGWVLSVEAPEESLVKDIYDHYPLFLLQERSSHQVKVFWRARDEEELLSDEEKKELHIEKHFSVLLTPRKVILFCPLRVAQGFDEFYSWSRRHRHLFMAN